MTPRAQDFVDELKELQLRHGLVLTCTDGDLELVDGGSPAVPRDCTDLAVQWFRDERTEELWAELETRWTERRRAGGRAQVRAALLRFMDHTGRYTRGYLRRRREAREAVYAKTARENADLFAWPADAPKPAHLCPTASCRRLLGHHGPCS